MSIRWVIDSGGRLWLDPWEDLEIGERGDGFRKLMSGLVRSISSRYLLKTSSTAIR